MKKTIEIQKKRIEELLKLIKENPDLPIVAMVDSEIVRGEHYARWLGVWGCARIDKYYLGENMIYFYDEAEKEEVLIETMGYDNYMASNEDNDIKFYKALPWIEAIIVNIDLP